MTKEWLDIMLDLSYISGIIDGINDTNQEELLNASEQIQKVIGADTEAAAEPVGGGGVMDVIDREQAMDALDALCDRVCEYSKKQRAVMCRACTLGSAFDVLEELPSARPKGKWIEYPAADGMNQCSECGVLRFGESNYCPNCGADMRGEDLDG